MKTIQKYEANDGSVWDTETECLAHESLCERIRNVMKAFPPLPKNDGCSFANGGGYIQLSEPIVTKVREQLLDLIGEKVTHKWVQESRGGKKHPSWVHRLLSDCEITPLSKAWYRICCVDDQWREWGQPYYAAHPTEGEQRQIAGVSTEG